MSKQAISLTDQAAERVRALLAKRPSPDAALRIGVRNAGCSGMAYTMSFIDQPGRFDEVVEDKGVRLLIDASAVMFLIGTEMDYVEEALNSGFVFNNPNEKGRCGCGESFHI
jgi:iron-sulfur cluster assembly protein